MASNDSLWDSSDDDRDFMLCEFPKDPTPEVKTSFKKSITQAKKPNKWIAPSFDGFDDFTKNVEPAKTTVSRKRPREPEKVFPRTGSFSKGKKQISDQIWVEKYTPKTQADLAVHKKKIGEVESWIEGSLKNSLRGRICLLTGPAGAGKTATVRALVHDLKLQLQEWSNPVTSQSEWREDFTPGRPDFVPIGGFRSETQSGNFRDFLLRANRYPTLQMSEDETVSNKIILVEEIPNFFSRDLSSFHAIVRQHCQEGVNPLIFILSDNSSGDSAERSLFPKQLQADLNIANISFNPIATTSLVKVLQKIASAEALLLPSKFKVPDKSSLSAISAASAGDIRGAINTLQFACLRGCSDVLTAFSQSQKADSQSSQTRKTATGKQSKASLKKGASAVRKKGGKSEESSGDGLAAIGGRDTSLFLFRALGKILYCKRSDPETDPDRPRLPPHLLHHDRDPLLIQPEDVIERCHLTGDLLTSYLHQNYVDFYAELEDVVRAARYLSDSDYLYSDWVGRATLQSYSASLAGRGLMHANSTRGRSSGGGSSGLGFKPLHKPAWYEAVKKMRTNNQDARSLFFNLTHSCQPRELVTELLPYLGLIRKRNTLKPGQSSFLHELCKFNKFSRYQSRGGERLDEKEVGGEEQEGEEVGGRREAVKTGTDSLITSPPGEEEGELTIEEFDD